MNEQLREMNVGQFNADLYQLYEDLSSKPPERILEFGAHMHREIDANEKNFKDAEKMHAFINFMIDTCISVAE